MKILAPERKSLYDSSPWTVGKWREEPTARGNGSCGTGLHSIICGDPLKSPKIVFPCEIWQDECEDDLGRDDIQARYRRQRIIGEPITDQFPIIVEVNDFIASLSSVAWFKPALDERGNARRKAYMRVETFDDLAAAWDAAWAAWAAWAARDAEGHAMSIMASGLGADTTWLDRWWEAWEMGFYPLREDGDTLVVGHVVATE